MLYHYTVSIYQRCIQYQCQTPVCSLLSWSRCWSHPLSIQLRICIFILYFLYFHNDLTSLCWTMSWRQIWWVDIKCCQRWLWRHSGWVSGSPNLTCRLTKVDQGHQQPSLISRISFILIQRKIPLCSESELLTQIGEALLRFVNRIIWKGWRPLASVWQKTKLLNLSSHWTTTSLPEYSWFT